MTPVELTHPVYHDESFPGSIWRRLLAEWSSVPLLRPNGFQGESSGWRKHGSGLVSLRRLRKKFTVRVGTVYERSHIPLHKWLLGFRLYNASKKGFSAHQLHRTLNITYKSAWFMAHRIREAMADYDGEPLGGKDKVVEADELFIGKPQEIFVSGVGWQKVRGYATKQKVMTLVERGGRARSFHVKDIDAATV